MGRSPLSRVVALLIALLVALSTSGLALAHGYAHHRLHEEGTHESEHHQAGLGVLASAQHDISVAIEPAHDSKDHVHPQLSDAVSSRADLKLFVASPPPVNYSAQTRVTDSTSLLLTSAPARAGPPGAPPRQPRAPPSA
jgi:hypothetical protein